MSSCPKCLILLRWKIYKVTDFRELCVALVEDVINKITTWLQCFCWLSTWMFYLQYVHRFQLIWIKNGHRWLHQPLYTRKYKYWGLQPAINLNSAFQQFTFPVPVRGRNRPRIYYLTTELHFRSNEVLWIPSSAPKLFATFLLFSDIRPAKHWAF